MNRGTEAASVNQSTTENAGFEAITDLAHSLLGKVDSGSLSKESSVKQGTLKKTIDQILSIAIRNSMGKTKFE